MSLLHDVISCPPPPQTGETVALKKVPLRRPEDGVPPQTLREIKALREIEDNPHVSTTPPKKTP